MTFLFGHSTHWQQQKIRNPLEAYLALSGFYLLLLIPVLMVFQRGLADVACSLLGVLLIVRSAKTKQWNWLKQSPVWVALCVWLYSAVIVTPLALDVYESFTRIGWIRFVLMMAAMVYWLSGYRDELRKVAVYIVFFLLLLVTDGLVQSFTGTSISGNPMMENRLTGPFDKVVIGIYLAKMSLPFIGILLYHVWCSRNHKQMMVILSALTAIFALILLSNERTAGITFIAGLGVMGLFLLIKVKPLRTWIVLLALIYVSLLAGIFTNQEHVKHRMEQSKAMAQDFDNSPYMQLWKSSYLIWQEHPFFGVGLESFRLACPALIERGEVHYCDNHAHNTYLEFLSEMGIFGLLGLLAMMSSFVMFVYQQRKKMHGEGAILIAFAFATLTVNFFPIAANQSFFANWPALLAWQSIAWALAITRLGEKSHE